MKTRLASVAAITVAATFAYATPASAQATRTWVSGVGDDVNPCSRTAPCKTFAGAISKTAAGGEINCLDPGGFGAVTIIKSMTISCPYTEGGALAGGNGVVFNMPATTDVGFIRGLDIFGVNPPTNGVRFINNGSLHIEDCTIRRFNAASSFGVSYQPSGASELYINNTTIAENGNAATGGGILIQPTGAGGTANVTIKNVRVENNANHGISINTTGATNANGTTVNIRGSTVAGNATGIHVTHGVGAQSVVVTVYETLITGNSTMGIQLAGTNAFVRVAKSTITGNTAGINAGVGPGTINTFGNNILISNPSIGGGNDGTFTGIPLVEQ